MIHQLGKTCELDGMVCVKLRKMLEYGAYIRLPT